MRLLEIACFNEESIAKACKNGADRLELCNEMSVGGITPSESMIEFANGYDIVKYVMIRPRGGNFTYTEEEFEHMKTSISQLKIKKINGFVFGVLTNDCKVDKIKNKELLKIAYPLPCTFHKAFDEISDYKQALVDCINCGFENVLTSGTKKTALEGKSILKELIELANNKINIIVAGGVRSSNISELNKFLNATHYHSAAIMQKGMSSADEKEIASLKKLLNE
ncbi:MAG: copper homeostasis protein CutC [Bacteroidetes bacterium]|jgi:copper homeostasis protein|nr:copper homeostasis protein CutC [Bacteroidota bacterium]MCA6442418.1 copper homeostasis protein CutC [Bacteroidota bacterium]